MRTIVCKRKLTLIKQDGEQKYTGRRTSYTFVYLPIIRKVVMAEHTQFGKWVEENPLIPSVPIASCPIATTLGVLGKKWSLLILRDISMRKERRFTELLNSVNGITRRVLSMRLHELEEEGIIKRSVDKSERPFKIRWQLTNKGWDALPILMSYFAFGSKWYARNVYSDKKPREVEEVFPQRQLRQSFVNLEIGKK